MELKDYLVVGICVIAALLLFFRMAKENRVFIGAGILCLCYGGFRVAQALYAGSIVTTLGWILRGIAVIMLIWMFTVLSGERAKSRAAEDHNTEGNAENENDA